MTEPDTNTTHTQRPLLDQIELLVEGELSSRERGNLLLRLDTQPEQWRTLALAFVEHQGWQTTIRDVCREDPQARSSDAKNCALPTGRVNSKTWPVAALAGCLLLVFMAGFGAGGKWQSAWLASSKRLDAQMTTAVKDPQPPVDVSSSSRSQTEGVVGYVEWVTSYGRQLSPVFEGDVVDQQWLESNPPQVDEKLQRTFARAGWQVRPARQLVSLTMEEGRRFLIPIDDLTYRYVGRQVY